MILIQNLIVPLEYDERQLQVLSARRLKVESSVIADLRILRKSVDARDKRYVHFLMHLLISLENEADEPLAVERTNNKTVLLYEEAQPVQVPRVKKALRPLVVGAGPAGLIAALTLARAGARPILIERGRPVEARSADVRRFMHSGELDTSSNILFGEGGAGTFSDGKLTTGIKSPYIPMILREFADCGAPEEILYAAKPHVGTDRLHDMVCNMRNKIRELGGEVRFETKLVGLEQRDGKLCAALVEGENGVEELDCDALFLCIGHSARDTFEWLCAKGVPMAQKPFSIGLRIEHPQTLIDAAQYGEFAGHPALGAAEYKLSAHLESGRSVYTFCMCPGGQVVPAASEQGMVNINGMSAFARDGMNANSALLVNVNPDDFGGDHPLAGVEFQRKYERLAFQLGGGGFRAPAQLVGDFMKARPSTALGDIEPSYKPGVVPGDLAKCLPAFAVEALREALPLFGGKIRGFNKQDAVLTGVETRSSSPLRIWRDQQTLESAIGGLYPCGEGAGYAGGILSAAADGARCAFTYLEKKE